jgi:hypothetical protein
MTGVVTINVWLDMKVVSCNSMKYINSLIGGYTFKFKMLEEPVRTCGIEECMSS